ncbi:MAG: TonB-dependent receptor [Methylicorpusculum sp.]|uniref:TonB-dependent receptor plug domain-containing protein n=1 Tax=Methylicorpusculum sp. TaxID=2713644 RepID=UPI0027165E13|nr:TonB-dependent receptor [Methylicorpusculum sp.]MDO8941076.1 TonB-dependent receptor [Methylicorpusculum sp.]MDP2202325.1 TonB-dependent receptor [Methylicorpusculum sp.]
MRILKNTLNIMLLLLFGQNAYSDESDMDELSLFYGDERLMSIATGRPVPQNLAPSVTSILTSEDIEKIGARRLEDVLEYLPGVHVSSARAGNKVIGFRGIYSETNAQVLILVNGIPLRNPLIGGKPLLWTLPVKNVSHIEVIRGPGSMLYGGDATTGVINVVLKTGSELNGGDIGSFIGSHDTFEGWAQYGEQNKEWEYSFSMQGGSTSGSQGRVLRDAQTALDEQFGTRASSAPGFTNNGRDDVDARLDVAYQDWVRLRAGYQRFNDVQTGEGAALALDNTGRYDVNLYNADVLFNTQFTENLIAQSNVYFLGQNPESDINLLPPGTFGGLLPEGIKSATSGFIGTAGFGTQINYSGVIKHNITLGTGVNYHWISDISNKTNAIVTPNFVQQINLTEVSNLGPDPIKQSNNRTNYYALVQDEWNFASDFYLTTGLRYDYYSDVDPGLSPRASLVWNVNHNLTTKLIYSRAFRPPSFFEQNQPLVSGSKIKSETINTVEFQIENKWMPDLTTSTNVYWFELENLITSTNVSGTNPISTFNNKTINGVGLETEGKYQVNEALSLTLNYSYHGLPDQNGTGLMPEHMVKSLINWEFTQNWLLGSQLNWIGERNRPKSDPRSNLSDYFIVGLTLSTKIAKPLELTFRANNVLGTHAKEPSLNPELLPGDVPVNDRSFLGQVSWRF